LRGPVIVHLDKGSMRHFSVLRGFDGDRVYLADPIGGNIRMPKFRFAEQWTGNALLVWIPELSLPADYPLQISAKDAGLENWSARRTLYKDPLPTVPWPRAP
jgi:ABC-type bacteriocin/lantibiotic exporter with double-glycine peptidase domain